MILHDEAKKELEKLFEVVRQTLDQSITAYITMDKN